MKIRWFITDACNLRCRQCNIANFKSKGENDIKGNRAYELIEQFAANHVEAIQFLGGEALLREDFLDILQYCKSRGLAVWLITNGFFVDEVMADKLVSNGLDLVMVSIDGASSSSHDKTRGHKGSFDLATAAVHHLNLARKKYGTGLLIIIDYILMRSTLPELIESLHMAKRLGADIVAYLNLLTNSRLTANVFGRSLILNMDEYWEALETVAANIPEKLQVSLPAPPLVLDYLSEKYNVKLSSCLERSCAGGTDTFDLHHDGHLYPCGLGEQIFYNLFTKPEDGQKKDIERWKQAKASINLKQQDFRDAYFSETYDVFLRSAHDRASLLEKLPDICRECQYSPTGPLPRCMPFCRSVTKNKEHASRALAPTLCTMLMERSELMKVDSHG